MNDIRVQVGNRIRELRIKKGMSQENLALNSGLDRTYINSVENGRRNITISTLNKIIITLDITLSEFFNTNLFNKGQIMRDN